MLFVAERALEAGEEALVRRMSVAMGLTSEQIDICGVANLAAEGGTRARGRLVILLGEEMARAVSGAQRGELAYCERLGSQCLVTERPAEMLRRPEVKRRVWDELQVAMRHLGLGAARGR